MYETSVFKIEIDFGKSYGSHIYDKKLKRYFLDFFGLYSSLPLGYNHATFNDMSYLKSYLQTASIKVVNCEIISAQGKQFMKDFSKNPAMKPYKHFWFCNSGGAAVELAIKTAIEYKKASKPVVVSLKESFHGISGYSTFVTDKFSPVSIRLEGLPDLKWPKVHNPKIIYQKDKVNLEATKAGLYIFEKEFRAAIDKYRENIVALLIEPIQATFGDNYFPQEFFKLARKICDRENIILIFDEIQTGFGSTGKMWYWQHVGIAPDIVIFGKKAQVSGVMVKKKFDRIFENPDKLSVTFDGDLSDMIRCSQILKAYSKYHILQNVNTRGKELLNELRKIKQLRNIRSKGLLVAFDFDDNEQQKEFARKAFQRGLIFNRTRNTTIRFRPNLNVSRDDINEAIEIIKSSVTLK